MTEGKGKGEQESKPRRKGWASQPMISNEVYKWAREKSGNTVKDSNNNNNAGGVRSPKYFI